MDLLDHMETLFLVLRGASILFSRLAASIYIQWPFLNSRIFQDSYFSSEKMSVEYEREKEVKLGARRHMWQKDHWPGVKSMFAHSVKGNIAYGECTCQELKKPQFKSL